MKQMLPRKKEKKRIGREGICGLCFASLPLIGVVLFGLLPILLGCMGLYHALTYARRSGRKGWWIPVILNILLILFGIMPFINPWADNPRAILQVIGGTLFYSAVVYLISLLWIWPFQQQVQ